ncbi:MAG TPA: PDZ domain-containing protein [Bryobacteraceae bacterium]|nr:PDZ domain-containing protein [Bryobacteraceae bacterium]
MLRCIAVLVALAVAADASGTRLLRQPTISPDRIAFVYAGDLWIAAHTGGTPERLTRTDAPEETPRFSPDGKWIAFHRGGDVFVIPASGGPERRLTWHPAADRPAGWTPDGRKLLIHSDRLRGALTESPHLFLLPFEGGLPEPLPMPRATHGSFSPDGQRIAYGPNPEIVLWAPFRRYRGGSIGYIAIYDIERNRYEELPRHSANDVIPMWHGDAIYFASDRDEVMNLYRYDLQSKRTERLTSYSEWDVRYPTLGPDAIVYENGGWLYTLDPKTRTARQVPITVPMEAPPDRTKWLQAIDEVWSKYAERGFHPAPAWAGIKPRYQELMKWAAHRSDAEYVLWQMVAEAGRSHMFLTWAGPAAVQPGAMLGADFRADAGTYRITKIYRGDEADERQRGPLAAPGLEIREGDFVLAMEGVALRGGEDIHERLAGRAGKPTRLTVNANATAAGAREIVVTPIADDRRLRYFEWVRRNRARVAEATGGRVGYLHVMNVDPPGVEEFRKEWRELRNRVAAIIIDVRNNSGGRNPEDILSWIGNKPDRIMYDFRGRVPPFGVYFDGPKVMIANDQSVSGGDEVPYHFKRNRMGVLIGTRTFGGMIGSGATYKIAGGWTLAIPEIGFYAPAAGEWYPENYGVEPDEVVELKPFPLSGGRDPQLERAIQVAVDATMTWSRMPEPPRYPTRARGR